MKKLSVLIALVLCVTIGGVYAAWTYTNPKADITDMQTGVLINISAATQEGAAGTYAIETNITGMSIDQTGTNPEGIDFHKAVLNYATSDNDDPYIKFTLKLKENTGNDIFDTLNSTYSVAVTGASDYDEEPIFVDHNANTDEIQWQYDSANDIYYYEITDMATEITLNDIVLPSKKDHTAFHTALGNAILDIRISDGVVPTT